MQFTNDGYFTSSITTPNTAIYDYSIIWRAKGKIVMSTYIKYGHHLKTIITTPILRDYTNYPKLKRKDYFDTFLAKATVHPPYTRYFVIHFLWKALGVYESLGRLATKLQRLYLYPAFKKTKAPKPSLKFTIYNPKTEETESDSDICPQSNAPPGNQSCLG